MYLILVTASPYTCPTFQHVIFKKITCTDNFAFIHVWAPCACSTSGGQKRASDLELVVSCWCWELNPCLVEEQPVLVTVGLSLHPQKATLELKHYFNRFHNFKLLYLFINKELCWNANINYHKKRYSLNVTSLLLKC